MHSFISHNFVSAYAIPVSYHPALTNSLAQKYHVFWVLRFFINPYRYLNPNPNHNPEIIHNPNLNPNPNPSPKQSNLCLFRLSRDQNSFLPITFQGSIF